MALKPALALGGIPKPSPGIMSFRAQGISFCAHRIGRQIGITITTKRMDQYENLWYQKIALIKALKMVLTITTINSSYTILFLSRSKINNYKSLGRNSIDYIILCGQINYWLVINLESTVKCNKYLMGK